MKEFYEAEGTYGSAEKFVDDRLNMVLALLRERPPERFLDVGCGDGYFCEKVRDLFTADVTGVDVSEKACRQARSRGLQALTIEPEALIPLPDEAFDTVFCGEVIEHVADTDLLLSEARRVLIVGGHLILTTPNLAAWYNRILLLFGLQPILSEVSYRSKFGHIFRFLGEGGKPVGHLRNFTRRSLTGFIEAQGFEILSLRACGWLCGWKAPNLVFELDKRISRLSSSLGSNLVVCAKKQ